MSSGRPIAAPMKPASRRRRRQCRAADQRPPTALADLLVGDQVDVDGSGASHGGHAHAGGEDLREPPAAAGPEYELGGIHAARELEQRGRDVAPDHLVVGAAEALHQEPLLGEMGRVGTREPIRAHHVHGQQIGAFGTRGDTGRPPDQRVSLRAAGQRQDDPLPSLPGLADPVCRCGTGQAGRRPCRPARAGPARAAR